jgi:hypothetical protein
MQKSIVWEGLRYDTEEHCAVNYLDTGIIVRAEIEGWAETHPVYADYVIKMDLQWNVLQLDINFHVNDVQHNYCLNRDADNNWTDKDDVPQPHLAGCRYIDISLTPFTNTLPVNGLDFSDGKPKEIELVYIDILSNEIKKTAQRYTKLNSHAYRYENMGSTFTADIEVDSDGFVTRYPSIFEMLKPTQ